MKPDIEMHDDGSATITYPKGYRGVCGRCMKNDATQDEWLEFDEPIPAIPELDIPEASGVWHSVCDGCAKA